MNAEFDWGRDRECVVIPEQRTTAVYSNGDGDVVVRQACWPEDDVWIVIARANVEALVAAMLREAGIEPMAPAAALLPKPSSSGAERSRRYRQRHAQRDGRDDNDSVTRDVTRDAQRDLGEAVEDELPLGVAAE